MVELALTLPLLTLILIGTADLGRALIDYTRLTNAVQAAALQGRFSPQSATAPDPNCYNELNIGFIDCRVVLESKGMVEKSRVQVQCWNETMTTPKNCSPTSTVAGAGNGDVLVVKADYRFRPLTSQLAGILGDYTMSKTIKMVITG